MTEIKQSGKGKLVETISLENGAKLAYAENRDQNEAFLFSGSGDDLLAMSNFEVVSGDPSYITIADGSQVLEVLCLMAEAFARWKGTVPFIAVAGKHGNPCGAAISWHKSERAILNALRGDSVAVMGGEVVTNFPVTPELGQTLFGPPREFNIGRDKWGLDVIFAPEFSSEAVELLGRKDRRRLLANPALIGNPGLPKEEWVYRPIRGGFLKQKAPRFILTPEEVIFWTNGTPLLIDDFFSTLIVTWAACWRASSNTVALAKDGMLIGLGCGQQDRIACVRLCLERANRAGHNVLGSLFASDGFFPYATSGLTYAKDAELIAEYADKVARRYKECCFGARLSFLKEFGDLANFISRYDRREGPELLADAGCIGGVVPADGKNLEQVQEFFLEAGMNVGFVAAEHRGFSKH